MHVLELLFELCTVLIRVLAENRHGSLEFAGADLFEIDAVAVQHAIEVRQLCDHADRTDDRERCRHDFACHAGHQVTATCRNFVDRDSQWYVLVADANELRCGQTVLMHHAAEIFQPHDDLIFGCRNLEYRADFLAQRGNGACPEVASEVDDERTRPPFLGLRIGLVARFLGFCRCLPV